MPRTADDHDTSLLCEALGVDPDAVALLHREPLGDGSVAGFHVRGESGSATVFLDSSRMPVPAETGLVHAGGMRVWTHPADPHLPALAAVAFDEAARTLLSRLGVVARSAPELVGYRPGRRAVLRVTTDDGDLWVKVVRPHRAERIADIHGVLRGRGLPVPAVRAWSPQGLLVLEAARGIPALEAQVDPRVLLDGVDRLRERLAEVPFDIDARTSLAARVPWYARRLGEVLPHDHELIMQAVAVADDPDSTEKHGETDAAAGGGWPGRGIHGDLHLGQLFVDPRDGSITGLIDVDTAGRGNAADDAAALLAHTAASALLSPPAGAERLRALLEAATARWSGDGAVRARTAVHLLGHALGAADGGDLRRARLLLREAAAPA